MRRRILLVEDSRTQALQLIAALEAEAGWEVSHASSAEQAITMLNTWAPDLILVDFYLPGVRGDEFCRQIRMRIDTRTVPTVILTEDSGQKTQLEGLESGADDFIAKSSDREAMLLRLRALISKPQPAPAPAPDASFRGARLLAVDDSPTFRAHLVGALSAESYRVEVARCGEEALERLKQEDFDCALVDLVMPGMDGIEVCRRINELKRAAGKSVMVLMLTSKEDNESLARALEAGADDFVGKSSDMIVVKGRIRALLRRRFYEDEHRQRLSAELRAKELEAQRAREQQEAVEARAALVDDLQRAAAALRRSNEELRQFAYVASHDLQEPLRVIASYVELLERRYKDTLGEEGRSYVALVVGAAVRMKRLIIDLLSYSRVETRAAAPAPVSLELALEDALGNLKTALQESEGVVTHDPLPVVTGDRTQLAQLFQNLVSNAIKYHGAVPPRVHISVEEGPQRCTIAIRDNGIGIEPQYFERIFVIFQRLHRPQDYPGTGIGLAIAKRIVERHGGRIWVESEPPNGSTFFFTLPRERRANMAQRVTLRRGDLSERDPLISESEEKHHEQETA